MGSSPDRINPKILKISICCFSAEHAALKRNSKDWLVGNRHNVPEWGDSDRTCLPAECCFSELAI
jgi:hypothetical protein